MVRDQPVAPVAQRDEQGDVAVIGEDRAGLIGVRPVARYVREAPVLRHLAALERDAERLARGAARPIGTEHGIGGELLPLVRLAMGDRRCDAAVVLRQRHELMVPDHVPAERAQRVAEHRLGAALRQADQLRKPLVLAGELLRRVRNLSPG